MKKIEFEIDGRTFCHNHDCTNDCPYLVTVSKDIFIKYMLNLTDFKSIDEWKNGYMYSDSRIIFTELLNNEESFNISDAYCNSFDCKDEYKKIFTL